jgi:hypothetical protein
MINGLIQIIFKNQITIIITIIILVILRVFYKDEIMNTYRNLTNNFQSFELVGNSEDFVEIDDLELMISEMKEELRSNRSNYNQEEIQKMNEVVSKYYALKATNKLTNFKNAWFDTKQQVTGAYNLLFNKDTITNQK